MFRSGRYASVLLPTVLLSSSFHGLSHMTEEDNTNDLKEKAAKVLHQPSFSATSTRAKPKFNLPPQVTLDTLSLISGSSNNPLARSVSQQIKVPLCDAKISRFADGEVSVQINEDIRGKDVYILQSCTAPVNDSIMELLLTVSCVRRASARRVVAIIPYYGYKHHRRGTAVSTKHNSRFLTSSPSDFALMLQQVGVDRVITVDLQRPGQGSEACFFDTVIPVESIMSTEVFLTHLLRENRLQGPLTIVSPNAEVYKKAKKYQRKLEEHFRSKVNFVLFQADEHGAGPINTDKLAVAGDTKLTIPHGDVIIVDDMIDTAGTIVNLAERLTEAGGKNIYVCASHGLFTEGSMNRIEKSKIHKILVTDSLPLPANASKKISQVSLKHSLADVILAEHFRSVRFEEEKFEAED